MKSFVSKTALIAGLTLAAIGGVATANTTAVEGGFIAQPQHAAMMSSSIVGATVYNGTVENAKAIGDVNDLVLADDGSIAAVVIGVGGFIGVGEKDVAVDYSRLAFATDGSGDMRIVLSVSKEELDAAPTFETTASKSDDNEKSIIDKAAEATNMTETDLRAVQPTDLRTSEFVGSRVYTPDGEWVGEIGDVVMGGDGALEAVIVDFGGWLGIGEKEIAVGMERLTFKTDQDDDGDLWVYVEATKEQLEAAPTYDEDAYKSDPDAFLLSRR